MYKSEKGNFIFQEFSIEFIEDFFNTRIGESRIGDSLTNLNQKARFVILGIEESIGPMANNGLSGSENAFTSFLKVFLNTQVHDLFYASNFSILGSVKQESSFSNLSNASKQVEELDDFVLDILNKKIHENQIPIVIGGGHNNAYPLIKWSANQGIINVINLDPHADCRETNYRHSGNSFSFAIEEKILNQYAVLGLHEAFNNEFIRNFLLQNNIYHTFYEDYLINERNLIQDFQVLVSKWKNEENIGVEIDMDAIAGMPSSAISPSGWLLDQVRAYLILAAKSVSKIAYLHLPEAAPKNEHENKIVGKALSYLVRDFINNAK